MATQSQIELYCKLCEELGQQPDDEFEHLDKAEASGVIKELLELVRQY